MKHCQHCGGTYQDDAPFCDGCGGALSSSPQPGPQQNKLSNVAKWAIGIVISVLVISVLEAILEKPSSQKLETAPQPRAASVAPATPMTSTAQPSPVAKPVEAASHWLYSESADEMSGQSLRYAEVISSNTVSFGFPYAGEQHGTLLLRKRRGSDNVILQIEKGQFLCTSYGGCNVSVRFDDKPARRFSAVGPADNSSTSLFIRNERSFIAETKKAKTVRIEAVVYQNGDPVFVFDTAGLKWDEPSQKKRR